MKSILLIIPVFLLIIANNYAQIQVNIKAGIGASNILRKDTGDEFKDYFERIGEYFTPKPAFRIGLLSEFNIVSKLSVCGGIECIVKKSLGHTTIDTFIVSGTYNYISVPLYLQYGNKQGVFAGISRDFLFSCNSHLDKLMHKQTWNLLGGYFISPFDKWTFAVNVQFDVEPSGNLNNHPLIHLTNGDIYYYLYSLSFTASYSIFSR